MSTLTLPDYFFLTPLVVVMNFFILMWQMVQVARARKRFDVKYPTLYESKTPSEFNCYQRAHQSALEWNTHFLVLLVLSALSTPIMSALAGCLYNVGRIFHAKGYYKGKAHEGLWGLYGLFYLVGGAVYTAIKLR